MAHTPPPPLPGLYSANQDVFYSSRDGVGWRRNMLPVLGQGSGASRSDCLAAGLLWALTHAAHYEAAWPPALERRPCQLEGDEKPAVPMCSWF